MMKTKKLRQFTISHMDGLGQGVAKNNEKIIFIGKTLPEESGEIEITRSAKGVEFATLSDPSSLTKSSENRISPSCPHFSACPSCHYLHTNYEDELQFKTNALAHLFRKHYPEIIDKIITHGAPNRTGYRNRIQLHYDQKKGLLGTLHGPTDQIIPIPECLIPVNVIKEKLAELYQNWQKLIPSGAPKRGHVELYFHNDQLHINWNESYASQGFSQVNHEMNNKMRELVTAGVSTYGDNPTHILDLFGGSGNLSTDLNTENTLVVDVGRENRTMRGPRQTFKNINLYREDSLQKLASILDKNYQLTILDPPRSGWKELEKFLNQQLTKTLIYVSCNPSTLARDLAKIKDRYDLRELHLIDMFPATFHYESLAILTLK